MIAFTIVTFRRMFTSSTKPPNWVQRFPDLLEPTWPRCCGPHHPVMASLSVAEAVKSGSLKKLPKRLSDSSNAPGACCDLGILEVRERRGTY